jgi:hypothetical protein
VAGVTRKAGSATPSIDAIAKTTTLRANPSEIPIGSASSPRPWRTTGRKIIHVTVKGMTMIAATGQRDRKRLSDEEELAGCWYSVAVDTTGLLSRSVGRSPRSPCLGASTATRRCWLSYPWLGCRDHRRLSGGGSAQDAQAIHAPLIISSTAPAGTVGGVAWAPIVIAYTRPRMYINTGANAQRAPAHFGRIPERQTATPSSTLSTNPSRADTTMVADCRVFARISGSL